MTKNPIRLALALLHALNQANAFAGVQLRQQAHGLVPVTVYGCTHFFCSVVDINPSCVVMPAVFRGQAHAVQQHTIEQLGVRGNVFEFLIRDQQAGDFEIDKFF